MQTIVKYIQPTVQRHLVYTTTRNFLCGLGLAYAVSNEKYLHIPLVFIAPSAYAGYHAYMNRDTIARWLRAPMN